jgi:hypothetical protein
MVLIEVERMRSELARAYEELEKARNRNLQLLAEIDRLTAELLEARRVGTMAIEELTMLQRSLGVRMSKLLDRYPIVKSLIIKVGNKTFPER